MSLTDTIAPTRERIAKGDIEAPSIDRRTDRRAYRAVTTPACVEGDLARAFADFVDDVAAAQSEPACIGSYGEAIGGGDKLAAVAGLIDRRIKAGWAIARAVDGMSDPTTQAAIIRLAAGHTPERIGRELLGKGNKPQAIAAATERIKSGCWHLAVHYGYVIRRTSVP